MNLNGNVRKRGWFGSGVMGLLWVLALGLLLSACTSADFESLVNQPQTTGSRSVAAPTNTPAPEPTATPAPTQAPTPEPPTPTVEPLPRGGALVNGDLERLIERAKQEVVQSAQVGENEIRVVSAEPVEWNDASLGCPRPGAMYAQVITPGYRIVLEANGEMYVFHTAATGEGPMVQCKR